VKIILSLSIGVKWCQFIDEDLLISNRDIVLKDNNRKQHFRKESSERRTKIAPTNLLSTVTPEVNNY
jgi:hypothetical protein